MKIIDTFKRSYQKHGSAWFTCGAVILTVAEGILAYRAGKRSGEHPEWTTKEKAINVVAPIGAGGAAVFCELAGQHKNAGEIATLISANALDQKKRKKFMDEATKVIGEDNMNKIKESMHYEKIKDLKAREDGKVKVVDDVTGASKYMTVEEAYQAVLNFHEYYHTNGFASWGKLLECFGMERFDGKTKPIPFDVDDYGEECKGFSDEQIGYSDCIVWDNWDCNWIPIRLVTHETKDGVPWLLIDPLIRPYAYYSSEFTD